MTIEELIQYVYDTDIDDLEFDNNSQGQKGTRALVLLARYGVEKQNELEKRFKGDITFNNIAVKSALETAELLQKLKGYFDDKTLNKFDSKGSNNDVERYEDLANTLKKSKNVILHGAPGTGKTYLANRIAMKLTGLSKDKLRNSDQYEVVQFHPNYDYTDFVEGLRPVANSDAQDNKEMSFELVDGAFKKFCNNAKENPDKSYVFVIDEINRGEISKIFGELFMVIDPGYRGKEEYGVLTQYSNMNGGEKFYVPSNVYVIGTMNDIDRSVDSFDFAMRRRFRFIEITAEEAMTMWNGNLAADEIPNASNRLKALNEEISRIDELNENYHIGPSYFLKLKEIDYDYKVLWTDYLKPLLEEYLRGSLDAEESLERLWFVYNGEGTEDEDKG